MNTTTITGYDELLARASASFEAAAREAELVDVATTRIDTPVGPLMIAATEAGIVRVAFEIENFGQVLNQLAAAISPRVLEVRTPLLDRAVTQLEAYFADAGAAGSSFNVPLDLQLARGPFRREVLALLNTIPCGETRTYRDIAEQAGRPNAVRAVGSGCAHNPVPVIVPCHRVLRTGGALGGYLGGVKRKRWLLDHEQRIAS
ncbi:MAG: methylated-DNA--[protein]-cysteine S-methyltransferase [Gaiellales bacterium]